MVWKCPKCGHKSQSYSAIQKHYFSKHYTSKATVKTNKGKAKQTFTFKPKVGHK